jgi:ABC-type uncharacterized transport system substrate-binding protein
LELLRELIANAAVFGALADPASPDTSSVIADLQAAAHTLGLQLVVVNARTDSDLETAFATFSQQRVDAVLVSPSAFFASQKVRYALSSLGPLFGAKVRAAAKGGQSFLPGPTTRSISGPPEHSPNFRRFGVAALCRVNQALSLC